MAGIIKNIFTNRSLSLIRNVTQKNTMPLSAYMSKEFSRRMSSGKLSLINGANQLSWHIVPVKIRVPLRDL